MEFKILFHEKLDMKRFLLSLLSYLSVSVLSAQNGFTLLSNGSAGLTPVIVQDFDLDGNVDILGTTANSIWLIKGTGPDNYEDPKLIWTSNEDFITIEDIADVDRDGDSDILLNLHTEIVILINQYNLAFQLILVDAQNANPYSDAMFIDMDQDQFMDVVMIGREELILYSYQDGFEYVELISYLLDLELNPKLIAADIDSDGFIDFIPSYENNDVYWFRNDGFGSIENAQYLTQISHGLSEIKDINSDGNLEIIGYEVMEDLSLDEYPAQRIMSINYPDDFGVYTSQNAYDFEFPFWQTNGPKIGDWNHDGITDMFFSIMNLEISHSYEWMEWNRYSSSEPGIWNFEGSHFGAYNLIEIPFDLDNDGVNDFLLDDIDGLIGFKRFHPDGNVTDIILDQTYSEGRSAAVLDFNQDDLDDLIIFNTSHGSVSWYENLGNEFAKAQLLIQTDYVVNSFQYADFQNDGDIDFFMNSEERTDSFVLYINNNLTFDIQYFESERHTLQQGHIADLNNDNYPDLYYYNENEQFVLHVGTNSGLFETNQMIAINGFVPSGHADIDNDGDFDLYGYLNGDLVFFKNLDPYDCQFQIENTWRLTLPEEIYSINFTDWNGDGFLDALTRPSASLMELRLCLGTGEEFLSYTLIGNFTSDAQFRDLNEDGLMDIISSTNQGIFGFIQYPDGLHMEFLVLSGQYPIAMGHFFDDGELNTVIRANDQLYIGESYFSDLPEMINGFCFLDANHDGVRNSDEEAIKMPIQISNDSDTLIMESLFGFYYIPSMGEATIQPLYNDENWQLTTDSVSYFFDDAIVQNDTVFFGFSPISDNPSVFNSLIIDNMTCLSSEFLLRLRVYNDGNTIEDGDLRVTFDTSIFHVYYISDEYSIVNGWFVVDDIHLLPGEEYYLFVHLENPGLSQMDLMNSFNSVFVSNGGDFFNNYTGFFSCPFDPNYIEVSPEGWNASHFIRDDDTLEYTIHFQNLGGAPAQNVSLINNLDVNIDLSSFHLIASSHPCDYCLSGDGQLRVDFAEINLAPIDSNYIESMGFITYEVHLKQGLQYLDKIYSQAHIVFDLNPPISTNTCFNTIMDCSVLSGLNSNTDELCANDTFVVWSEGVWIDQYEWYLDNQLITEEPLFATSNLATGFLEFFLQTSNPICLVEESKSVQVFELPVNNILMTDEEVIALGTGTPVWFVDNRLINFAGDSLKFSSNGWYCLQKISEHGCSSDLNCVDHQFSQMEIFPTPSEGKVTVRIPDETGMFELYDMNGKLIRQARIEHLNFLDFSELTNGLYYARIHCLHCEYTSLKVLIQR